MARSLARSAVLLRVVRRQGSQPAIELVDARLQRGGLAVAIPQDEAADHAEADGDEEIDEVAHRRASPTSSTGRAPVAQSTPSAHVSRFQIGNVALSVSMPQRAASKASSRCGALTPTTTEASPTANAPVRCSSATRPSVGHRRKASSANAANRASASSAYASYSNAVTPARPSAWSRTVPANTITAPQSDCTTHVATSSTGSTSSVRPVHVRSEPGGCTCQCYGQLAPRSVRRIGGCGRRSSSQNGEG